MIPYLQDPDVTLYHGDALDVLRELPDESVHCIATSPPFYALRDYGVDGQIGLEETPDAWAAALVAVFREARRVLRKDGTLWVECGDSYNANVGSGFNANKRIGQQDSRRVGYKAKDLLGTPWLLAFALRADGWWLRGCNIWAKPNAMPESAKDRCTTAHSYVFQLSRSARYYFDGDAITEPYETDDRRPPHGPGQAHAPGGAPGGSRPASGTRAKGPDGRSVTTVHQGPASLQHRNGERWPDPNGRRPRSVWTIPTQGYPEAHFATWPEALARRIILAATSEKGVCPECGAPWVRETEVHYEKHRPSGGEKTRAERGEKVSPDTNRGTFSNNLLRRNTTLGWRPSCECPWRVQPGNPDPGIVSVTPVPATILDPFVGSGTTCHVARKLGRRSVGIDLSAEYLALAAKRLAQQSLLAVEA